MGKVERTKQFIIELVAPVFNKKGHAATSLKDLTDATGLTKGSIYSNFRNKDEVALSVYKHKALTVYNNILHLAEKNSGIPEDVPGHLSADFTERWMTQVLTCLFEGGFAMSKVTRDNGYIENALSHMEPIVTAL